MTNTRTGFSLTAALTLSALALTSPAFGQEGSGRQGVLSFSQGIEFSDNPGLDVVAESGTTTVTTFGLTLSSETRNQSIEIELGAEITGEFGSSSSDEFELENTLAALRYTLEGANSVLRFSASYSETTLEDSVFLSGGSLVIDTGILNATSIALGVDMGIEGPFGLEVDVRHRDRDYRNTSDPDLTDTKTTTLDALALFRINPSFSLRARAGLSREDEVDIVDIERDMHYFGIGLEGETGGGLTYFGDIIYDRTETTTSTPSSTTDDGVGIEAGLTQDRVNGEIGVLLESRTDDSGRRTTANLRRSLEFPEGDVAFSLGVVDQEGDDSLRFVGGLDYSRELSSGVLTARLSQDAVTDSGTPYLNTALALVFRQDINATSSWEAGLEYFESNQLGGSEDDTRGTATLAYMRDLTEDWHLRTGFEHIRTTEVGVADRSSNTVFFSIGRDITFGF